VTAREHCTTSSSCPSSVKSQSVRNDGWKDGRSRSVPTDGQLNKLPDLPLPAVHLFRLYRGEGPGPCPPLLLPHEWLIEPLPGLAPLLPPFVKARGPEWCQRPYTNEEPPRLSISLHPSIPLSLSPSQRANRSDSGPLRANSGSTKTGGGGGG